jgi:hypothetical protein
MIEDLDRIKKLGFDIELSWNDSLNIYYNANDVYPASSYFIDILNCSYYNDPNYTFSDMLITCFDIFYEWYNKNLDLIKRFDKEYTPESLSELEDSCPRDVNKQVARELKLTDLLELFDKYKTKS